MVRWRDSISDRRILDAAAVQADQVVVVLPSLSSEDRLAASKWLRLQDAGLLELHQHPVHGGQADVGALGEQDLEDILGRHVALLGALEDVGILMRGRWPSGPSS